MLEAPDLPADYYRQNFLQLLDFVAEHYWQLLPEDERAFYQRFKDAPVASQQLYIRLLSRRGEHFLLRKLNYPEIGDLQAAAARLSEHKLLAIDPEMALDDLLPLFTKAELLACLHDLDPALRKQDAKASILAQLSATDGRDRQLIVDRLHLRETVLMPLDTHLFTCFQLCFFGNLRQDLTDFVLRDLGLQRYEQYPLNAEHAPFRSAAQLLKHLEYYALIDQITEQSLQEADTLVALWRELPEPDVDDPTLQRRVQRTTNTLARQLERLAADEEALLLYQSSERPPARERRARILMKRGDTSASLALCRQIALNPRNEEELIFAGEFSARHTPDSNSKRSRSVRYQPPEIQLSLAQQDGSVEMAVAQYYATEGDCYYVENRLFNGVLGLFIWDILFTPVRGAFFNPFQSAPADFREHSFTRNRETLLQHRFAELTDRSALRRRIMDTWRQKHGLLNPLVYWEGLSEDLLEMTLNRVPSEHLQPLLQRILDDVQHNRSGLPDLILFPREGDYRLIEVKAPGDQLQKNQRRWMAYFDRHDIPHQVCHVDWTSR